MSYLGQPPVITVNDPTKQTADSNLSALAAGIIDQQLTNTTTSALQVPAGNTSQRPTGAAGKIRYNNELNTYEGHNGTSWGSIGGGSTGGDGDKVFFENDIIVNNNHTITSGINAMSAGPITIASGVTVTVPSGSTWTVV